MKIISIRWSAWFFMSMLFTLQVYAKAVVLNGKVDVVDLDYRALHYATGQDTMDIMDYPSFAWKPINRSLDFGPNKEIHWLKFDFKIIDPGKNEYSLFIPYNHIHSIECWKVYPDSLVKLPSRGTFFPFKDKRIKSMGYEFKLNTKNSKELTLVIKVKHLYRPLRANMFVVKQSKLQGIVFHNYSLNWFWRGVFFVTLFISLVIYLSTKHQVFLSYFMLNLAIAVYLSSQFGDYNYLFNTDKLDLTTLMDFIGAFGVSLYFPLFLNTLTPVKKRNPILWKVIMFIVFAEIPIIALNIFPAVRLGILQYYSAIYIMIVAGLVILMQPILLVRGVMLKDKNAKLLLVVYSFYVFSVLTSTTLPNLGLMPSTPYIYNSLLIGSLIEIFTFLIIIARESLKVYADSELLRNKQKKHQKELLLSIIKTQEQERHRTGRELHDSVGGNIAIISQQIGEESVELQKLLGNTIESIRNISHGLVSPTFEKEEFMDELKELCYKSATDRMKVHTIFNNWPKVEDESVLHHLYRIVQELMQNALRHSQAKAVFIQFSGEESKLNVVYEDNGVGFDYGKTRGIGLKNIRDRLEIIHGEMFIDSKVEGFGTTIIIEINLAHKSEC